MGQGVFNYKIRDHLRQSHGENKITALNNIGFIRCDVMWFGDSIFSLS